MSKMSSEFEWPDDLPAPSAATLFTIPGYNSDENPTGKSGYMELMRRYAASEPKAALALHKMLVASARRRQIKPAPRTFATEQDFYYELFKTVRSTLQVSRPPFEVQQACKLKIGGTTLSFIGMEQYKLIDAEISGTLSELVITRYRFAPVELGGKQLQLGTTATHKLFGAGPYEYVLGGIETHACSSPWREARQRLQEQQTRSHYAAAGIEFGSW